MLNVSYKNRIGYYTEKQTIGDKSYKYKMWFCHANCLCAIMYFYDEVGADGKKTAMAQVHGFFCDVTHAKRCIDDKFFRDCSNFHFYAKEMNTELWNLVKEMTKRGIKVTIE